MKNAALSTSLVSVRSDPRYSSRGSYLNKDCLRMKFAFLISLAIFAMVNILIACVSTFENPIDVEFLNAACIKPHHRYLYTTCQEISVRIDDTLIYILAEYETDLASIPRWLWSFVSPAYSSYVQPSILHDYLYQCPGSYTRKQADDIFYYSLLKEGVSTFGAYKIYWAVRIFGAKHFNDGQSCIYRSNFPAHEKVYLL